MVNFEKATKLKLRFQTEKGILTIEDLWDLSLQELNRLTVSLKKQLKELEEEDFLSNKPKNDEILELKFNLALHILTDKKTEMESRKEEKNRRIERERLLAILQQKEDEEMKEKSAQDIRKLIEELG